MCTLSVSNVIYHKFSHGAAFYTLNGKNVNVMLEFFLYRVKVFPCTNCQYGGVKVTCFGKSVRVLIGEFSTFTIQSLPNNIHNTIGKLNLIKFRL